MLIFHLHGIIYDEGGIHKQLYKHLHVQKEVA